MGRKTLTQQQQQQQLIRVLLGLEKNQGQVSGNEAHMSQVSTPIDAMYCNFYGCKSDFFQVNNCHIFPICTQNIDFGYLLELPLRQF